MNIERDLYLQKLIDRMGNHTIKVVTGIRRCGKSYLLFQLFKNYLKATGVKEDHIIEAALDDEEFEALLDHHALARYVKERIIDQDRYYILLDEIQEVKGFERTLNSFLRIENADVYVTGSNSTLLSSEIATIFRDRGDEIRIHPLRFKEFVSAYNGKLDEAWDDYMTYGGLPQVLSYSAYEDKATYLTRLFERTYLSDIVDRNGLRRTAELDELVNILASNIGSLTNPTKLENAFKSQKHVSLNHQTIHSYIGYLENAFLISKAQRYDVKGKKYINTPYKVYFEDMGLRNARLNFRQTEQTHIMENVIYNELIIRGFSVDVGIVEAYSKLNEVTQKNSYEVDFVANKGSRRLYIQSAMDISSPEKLNHEQASLRRIDDSFQKFIVVRDNIKPRQNDEGVVIVGLLYFLTNESLTN